MSKTSSFGQHTLTSNMKTNLPCPLSSVWSITRINKRQKTCSQIIIWRLSHILPLVRCNKSVTMVTSTSKKICGRSRETKLLKLSNCLTISTSDSRMMYQSSIPFTSSSPRISSSSLSSLYWFVSSYPSKNSLSTPISGSLSHGLATSFALRV